MEILQGNVSPYDVVVNGSHHLHAVLDGVHWKDQDQDG